MMRHRPRLIDVLQRAETGPLVDEADFERKLIAPAIKRLVDKYAVKFDRSAVVPDDEDLTDRVFQAGLELAVEVGMFCQNTSRRITWTQHRGKQVGFRLVIERQESGYRQVAPRVVVSVEQRKLLASVGRVVGRVQIDRDPAHPPAQPSAMTLDEEGREIQAT